MTGLRRSINSGAYVKIGCRFNDTNYWLNLKGRSLSRKGKKLDLDNKIKWLKLFQNIRIYSKHEKKPKDIGIWLMKVHGQVGVREGILICKFCQNPKKTVLNQKFWEWWRNFYFKRLNNIFIWGFFDRCWWFTPCWKLPEISSFKLLHWKGCGNDWLG